MDGFGIQGGGTNSVGFTLIDGNGTTANGSAVDLGGIITDTTSVYYDIAPNEQFGLFYLMNGIIQDGTPPNEAIFIGQLPNGATSPDMSMRNGLTVLNVDNTILGTIIGNDKAVIEVVKQPEGYGAIDIEVKSPDESIISALKITPSYMTFGEYIDADNIYLSIDGDFGIYGFGKLDPNISGTKIIIDDSLQTIKATNIPIFADHAAADADANLGVDCFYKLTGDRAIYQKP